MNSHHIFKYYLNAAHSVDNRAEHAHTHTFTVAFRIEQPGNGEVLPFRKIDQIIEGYMQNFRGQYLNDRAEFKLLNPTLENIGEVIYDAMSQKLKQQGQNLLEVEICENPLRVYSVSNCILLPSAYAGQMDKNWAKIIDAKRENLAEVVSERS